jgi:pilus assembly protein Flp/PilA
LFRTPQLLFSRILFKSSAEFAHVRTILAFLTDCSGATSIEYAMVASMIAVAILAGVTNLGSAVKSNYTSVSTALQ